MPEIIATVLRAKPEARRAVTLRLGLNGAAFAYRPGQYIEIDPHQFEELAAPIKELETKKGFPEPPRSFSLSSDGSDPGWVEISVKEDQREGPYDVLLTPHLVARAREGMRVTFAGPNGTYCLPEAPPERVAGFLHLCAGSGVAPNRGMIRYALARGWPQRHLLVLQNRTEEDIFYRDEWPDLLARHADRLRVRHLLSQGPKREYVTPEGVKDAMAGWIEPAASMALVCGPNRPREIVQADGSKRRRPGFCDAWVGNPRRGKSGILEQLGFRPERILTEMW